MVNPTHLSKKKKENEMSEIIRYVRGPFFDPARPEEGEYLRLHFGDEFGDFIAVAEFDTDWRARKLFELFVHLAR